MMIDCNACNDICNSDYMDIVQDKLNKPMPWIGMYIAAASAACSLAMAADLFSGFRNKRFWFPCKYFSLNAISLTMLAVMTKLPADLTNDMRGVNDKLALISSIVLMSIAMANFMTSLGSVDNNEMVVNLAALSILVITLTSNVSIHVFQMREFSVVETIMAEELVSILLMLFLLLTFCSLALTVPSAKRYLEAEYNEMQKIVSSKPIEKGEYTLDELRVVVKRYWVMSETGSLQFVMARAAISVTASLICPLLVLTLFEAHLRLHLSHDGSSWTYTNYAWSTNWILYIQSAGVVFGGIAPLFRWLFVARFKISELRHKRMRDELFYVETYWTSKLVEWRETSLPLQIHNFKCRKLVHDAKGLVLNICIRIQIFFVLASKLILLTSCKFGTAILLCFHHMKDLNKPNDVRGCESMAGTGLDFSRYVLLLEGEVEVPKKVLQNICDELDMLIQIGEEKKPRNLIELLMKSTNFKGVREFDSNEVPSLHSLEPPNCWSLPVVTLTSIVVELPNVTNHKTNMLLRGVREGLSLVELIEKTLNRKGDPKSIRNAADRVWVGIELYGKWERKHLKTANLKVTTGKELLQKLSDVAKKTVVDFMTNTDDFLMQNPVNWPAKVIAANSMYRISQTILLAHKDDRNQTNEALFERLAIIISDILAACLTNLVHVITLKCHQVAIKERQESVRHAAILLGESREVLEILQHRHLPSLGREKAADIDEWRAFMEHNNEKASALASSTDSPIQQSNGEHVCIELEG
ncbi:hypothetical protein C2S53_015507 [Perilla frutescens var. hirtella]|uniref:Uncharacterized protein n=1 Tax=Perilla frutescens var. hirtella TaxID=608512 RepID=A0AAD4IMC2_PERFH|nr:hypothetical protein C2S53_015507 [Perilla frutescens var. hirtella]